MPYVRTILGDIDSTLLGVCYAHEHVVIDESYTTQQTPDFLLADVTKIELELADFRAAGGRAMVDSMPGGGAGRNAAKLAKISRQSAVHILCPTGLHLAKYYPADHWALQATEEQLANLLIGEIERGIAANDLSSPDGRTTLSHRAGLIKVAGGLDRLSAHERKLFRAAGRAQRSTGAPILTHTEQGTAALEQIEILAEAGADLSHVVLSHTDRRPEMAYHRQILKSGVKVEYDSAFRWKPGQGNPTLELCCTLLPEFRGQIMLGMDAARSGYWKSFGGSPGLAYLLSEFVPKLRESGIEQRLIDRVFIDTPAETFSFIERKSS
ncbi:phosphotriesterase-related protein [soil metagenome]